MDGSELAVIPLKGRIPHGASLSANVQPHSAGGRPDLLSLCPVIAPYSLVAGHYGKQNVINLQFIVR